MGFFRGIMKGLGFESKDNPKQKIVEPPLPEIPPVQEKNKYQDFDNGVSKTFNIAELGTEFSSRPVPTMPTFSNGGSNVVIYAPKENKDIKMLVECLRRKESCIVNLANLNSADAEKILDFLSGAVYALRGSLKRLQGDLFVLTPEGVNIMTPTEPKVDKPTV